jgi:hypothetical protein
MNFFARNWRGLLAMALGVATVVATTFFLHACADEGHFAKLANGMEMHMGCTWTERAVTGIGGLVAVVGILMIVMREAVRALSLTTLAAGALMIITPIWLIPTCKNPTMPCNLSLKPGTLLLGGLIVLAGLAGALKFTRSAGPDRA